MAKAVVTPQEVLAAVKGMRKEFGPTGANWWRGPKRDPNGADYKECLMTALDAYATKAYSTKGIEWEKADPIHNHRIDVKASTTKLFYEVLKATYGTGAMVEFNDNHEWPEIKELVDKTETLASARASEAVNLSGS